MSKESVAKFFQENALWWAATPTEEADMTTDMTTYQSTSQSTSQFTCPYRATYTPSEVLERNPAFALFLPAINQHVVTLNGQEARESVTASPSGKECAEETRGALLRQFRDMETYARALSNPGGTWTYRQRFYLQLLCPNRAVAERIGSAVQDLCLWECSFHDIPRSGNWTGGRLPVTISVDAGGFVCVHTQCFAAENADFASWHRVLASVVVGAPTNVPILVLAARNYRQPAMTASELTHAILGRVVEVLQQKSLEKSVVQNLGELKTVSDENRAMSAVARL